MGWVVNATPRPLYPRERPGTHCIGGWMGSRAGLDRCGKSRSHRDCCLCILIVVYVFLDAATLTEVFPCFFLGCKANARVLLAKTGHGPHSSKIVVLFYVLFVLYRSRMHCLCVNVCCAAATG